MRIPQLTIKMFAVACVAATSAYLMAIAWKLNTTLSGPGWCATAFGAGKATGTQPVKGLEACVGLMTIQLQALSLNSHIVLTTFALCLAVLVIVVLAGARFSADTKFGKVDVEPAPVPVVVKQPADKPVPVTQEKDDAADSAVPR